MESPQNMNVDSISYTEVSNYKKDLLIIVIYLFASILLFIYGNFTLSGSTNIIVFVFGIISIYLAIVTFLKKFKEAYSVYYYYKAVPEVNFYLRGIKPICPYLNVNSRGFTCSIDFTNEFNVVIDLPKCHNENLSKLHWKEKAPDIFEQLKQETDKKVLQLITTLGNVKYKPVLPYLIDMFKLPGIDGRNYSVFNLLSEFSSLQELNQEFNKLTAKSESKNNTEHILLENEEFKSKSNAEFNFIIDSLVKHNIIEVEGENVSKTELSDIEDFPAKWKLYSKSIVKQYLLASLGIYEEEELIPLFLDVLISPIDKKLTPIAMNALKRQKDKVDQPLMDLINDDNILDEKRTALINLCGNIQTETIFNFLKEFISTSDNNLLIAYAITSIGRFDGGNSIILDFLENDPDDLVLETGRASLVSNPNLSFELILSKLKVDGLSDDFIQIIISIIEDLNHTEIFNEISTKSDAEQDEIIALFEKYELDDYLELFLLIEAI